ncbi:MAG: OmpA family protein [Desulfobulbaceae bacterium]|nr:OmpA family protein [Desulfobulbaceae bacterium]
MGEKKKKCPPVGAPAWMCTFADMMSLLLCFFVLLLSFANMDETKFEMVAGSLEQAFGTQRERPLLGDPAGQDMISMQFPGKPIDLTVQVKIIQSMEKEVKDGLIEVEEDENGVTLRVKESVAFDSGRAEIKPRFREILNKLGKLFVGMNVDIEVGGHTDNMPLKKKGEYASNWGLSTSRAVNVVEYWVGKYKFAANRISAVGYADGHPLASNSTAVGRARNRRVEFKVRGKGNGEAAFEGFNPLAE